MPYIRPNPDGQREPGGRSSGFAGSWAQAEKLMQIALVIPSGVLIGWLGGAWLDKHLHQSWIGLVGIGLGSVAGMVSAIRMAMDGLADLGRKTTGSRTEKGK
jgi:ATP synthase protein I